MTESAANLVVDVQMALTDSEINESEEPPSAESLTTWAGNAYRAVSETATELTVRVVDNEEIVALNQAYRDKQSPTNVLSFPFQASPEVDIALLGDVVICHPVLVAEARQQAKSLTAHYAHMVTHGVLHLCGYGHQDDASAQQMESLEISILAAQGIANPYQ